VTKDSRMVIPNDHDTPGDRLAMGELFTKEPSGAIPTKMESPRGVSLNKESSDEALLITGLSKEAQEQEYVPTQKDQYEEVNSIYNNIKSAIREINDNSTKLQAKSNNAINDIDTFPIANSQKNKMKTHSPRILNLAKTISRDTAQVLIMEQFEKDFRSEWTIKKKASVLQRDAFLDKKQVEFAKIRKSYMEEWTKSMKDAGMTVLEGRTSDEVEAATEAIEDTEAKNDDKANESDEKPRDATVRNAAGNL
jgi:hypothetical protein